MLKQLLLAGAVCTASIASFDTAEAAPVNVDIMFVIDQSGSMSPEFASLAANISTFATGLSGNADVLSLGIGLVTYEEAEKGVGFAGCGANINEPCLRVWNPISTSSDLTSLQSSLSTAGTNTFGGTEDSLTAVDSVLPGGALFGAAGWRNDTVKSVVLITDENADDAGTYTYDGLFGYEALGKKLSDVKYLNNIITESGLFNIYRPASRPLGPNPGDNTALFDLDDFTGAGADPNAFLAQFAAAKLSEITTGGENTGGSSVVPLPAAGWLLIAGLGGLGAMRRRKGKASA